MSRRPAREVPKNDGKLFWHTPHSMDQMNYKISDDEV